MNKALSLKGFKAQMKEKDLEEIKAGIIDLVREGVICPIHKTGSEVIFIPALEATGEELKFFTEWLKQPYFEI